MRDNLSFAFFLKWFECWQKLFSFDLFCLHDIEYILLKVVDNLKCVMPTAT